MNKNLFKSIVVMTMPLVVATHLFIIPVQNIDQTIIFDGKKFNSETALFNHLLKNKVIKLNDHQVLGDLERSYLDYSQGLLNKNYLPNYDPNKMEIAWKTADGQLTKNYNEAKESYFNPALVVKRYSDGYGDWFEEHDEALKSRNSKINVNYQSYYNLEVFSQPNESGNTQTIPTKINPFNSNDVKYLKDNISQKFRTLLTNEFLGQNNSPYTISLFNGDKEISKKSSVIASLGEKDTGKLETINDQDRSIIGNGTALEIAPVAPDKLKWRNTSGQWIGEWCWNDHFERKMTGSKSKDWKFTMTNDGGHWGFTRNGGFYWSDKTNYHVTDKLTDAEFSDIISNPAKNTILEFPEIFRDLSLEKIKYTDFFPLDNKLRYKQGYLPQNYQNVLDFWTGKGIWNHDGQPIFGKFVEKQVSREQIKAITQFLDYQILNAEYRYKIDFNDMKVEADFFGHGQIPNWMQIKNVKGIRVLKVLDSAQFKVDFQSELLQQVNYLSNHQAELKNFNDIHFKILYKPDSNNSKWAKRQPLFRVEKTVDDNFELTQNYHARNFQKLETLNQLNLIKDADLNQLIVRYNINLNELYTFDDAIKHHLFQVKKFLMKYDGIDKFFNQQIIDFNNIIILGESDLVQNLNFGFYYLTSFNDFNPKLKQDNPSLSSYVFATDEFEKLKLELPIITKIAKQYIVYNLNGKQISLNGQNHFDTFEIVKENILNHITPQRSYDKIFLKDKPELVRNFKNHIVELVLNDEKLYFATYKHAYEYVIKHFLKKIVLVKP